MLFVNISYCLEPLKQPLHHTFKCISIRPFLLNLFLFEKFKLLNHSFLLLNLSPLDLNEAPNVSQYLHLFIIERNQFIPASISVDILLS